MTANLPLIEVEGLGKSFTLHLRGGLELPVVKGVGFAVHPGECDDRTADHNQNQRSLLVRRAQRKQNGS